MAIEQKDLFSITHYEYGEAYYGSAQGMRYRVARHPLKNVHFDSPEERADGVIRASVWPEPYSYAHTDAALIREQDFPFTEEGLKSAVSWLNAQAAAW